VPSYISGELTGASESARDTKGLSDSMWVIIQRKKCLFTVENDGFQLVTDTSLTLVFGFAVGSATLIRSRPKSRQVANYRKFI
jgi:hypothetical protein